MPFYLYKGTDNAVRLKDLTDISNFAETLITSATVVANLYDSDGTLVAGPKTMTHIATADYEGFFTDTEIDALDASDTYTIEVVADDGVDRKATWRELAYIREGQEF